MVSLYNIKLFLSCHLRQQQIVDKLGGLIVGVTLRNCESLAQYLYEILKGTQNPTGASRILSLGVSA